MNQLELKINEINMILEQISVALESINEENINEVLSRLNLKLQKITTIKTELESKYEKSLLKSHEGKLNILTKQIYERFDNIISEIKTEQGLIQTELINIQNKKKLVNYNR